MKMGSLFSGIGGLELGLERAIPGLQTVWQVEKEPFCRSILERHWPNTKRYNDVRTIGAHNLEPVDVICAGFPCQSISVAGLKRGLEDEQKSGLWWQVHRIVSDFQQNGYRQPILVLENVANIIRLGGPDVVGSLAAIGYDVEWTIISAAQCGAPHVRRRWFAVAYPSTIGYYVRNERAFADTMPQGLQKQSIDTKSTNRQAQPLPKHSSGRDASTNTTCDSEQQPTHTGRMEQGWRPQRSICEGVRNNQRGGYWATFPTQSPVCRRDDGIPNRVHRLKALGNAVVPQCAEWVGQQILKSGLLEAVCSQRN